VVFSRAAARMVMPVAVLLIGLALAWFAHRGTADLLRGIRSQPTTYAYILPVLIAMGAVIFYPFLKGVEFAFLDASAQDFVGLANFKDVLIPSATSQSNFWRTLVVTVLWTVLNVGLHVSIGLGLALILNNPKLRLKGIYRVLLIVPWAVPNYITALTWKTMFNAQYGAVNILLNSVGIGEVNWFGPDFITNFAANLITNVWLGFPFMMVVSLGALQSIPGELYEAADIDGAGRWQKFRTVTLPLLKPALFPAIILGTIWTFNMFNIIYLVSGGGPDHKTEILITEAYYLFKVLNQYGLAAAYCLMIFLILLSYTWMTNRITKATEGAFE
jgi:arabinogalactan oligomer/maltooligosaccharide transport system permease protein